MPCNIKSFITVFSHIRTIRGDNEGLCATEPGLLIQFSLKWVLNPGPLAQQDST